MKRWNTWWDSACRSNGDEPSYGTLSRRGVGVLARILEGVGVVGMGELRKGSEDAKSRMLQAEAGREEWSEDDEAKSPAKGKSIPSSPHIQSIWTSASDKWCSRLPCRT